MSQSPELLTTAEVAAFLRLRERKVYDLVRQGHIPCVRVTGKLLFPRQSLELWLLNHLEGDRPPRQPVPTVLAGSHDPLLEWAIRESGAGLATLCLGSGDGVRRLLDGSCMVAGLHLVDPASGAYNDPERLGLRGMQDLVMIHWARRRQGLVLAAGNPLGIGSIGDLVRTRARVVRRPPDAGADALLRMLLAREGIDADQLGVIADPAFSEDDLALAIRAGDADAGVAVEAAARRHDLHFLPLQEEDFDLAMRRRSFFETPVQCLLAFAGGDRFLERARALGGYDFKARGTVRYNA